MMHEVCLSARRASLSPSLGSCFLESSLSLSRLTRLHAAAARAREDRAVKTAGGRSAAAAPERPPAAAPARARSFINENYISGLKSVLLLLEIHTLDTLFSK